MVSGDDKIRLWNLFRVLLAGLNMVSANGRRQVALDWTAAAGSFLPARVVLYGAWR